MKQHHSHRLPALLLAMALTLSLTACTQRQPTGEGGSSGTESTSSTSPESQTTDPAKEDEVLPPASTPHEVAEQFVTALTTGNITALEDMTAANRGSYEAWRDIVFTDIQYTVRYEDVSTGHYEFTFVVEKSDVPAMPVGTNKRMVVTGFNEMLVSDRPIVQQMYDPEDFTYEQNPYDMELPGYEAYSTMNNYLNIMSATVFDSAKDIPEREIAEYALIITASEDNYTSDSYPAKMIHEKATQLFGLDSFDGTDTEFYDKATDSYMLLGRGGNYRYMQSHTATATADGYTILVDFFYDPLCVNKIESVLYTLQRQGDYLRIMSGVVQ